jgi:hypothetical protein
MTTKEAERIAVGLVIIAAVMAYAAMFMDIMDILSRMGMGMGR